MVTRLTAVFGSPEDAESALREVREHVRGVYSASCVRSRITGKNNSPASMYTSLPTAVSCLSAVVGSPVSSGIVPHRPVNRKTTVFIVCDGSGIDKISSILTSMGGSDIK